MTDPNDTPALDLGCGDSGCVVARSGGMSTNGGCGCVPRVGRPMTPEVRAELRRILTVRREQVDGLVARIAALTAERDDAVRFRDAYKRAKAENDERFMIERDEARQERDAVLARVRELEAAAQTVADATRAEERERCARVLDAMAREAADEDDMLLVASACAVAIRSGREP